MKRLESGDACAFQSLIKPPHRWRELAIEYFEIFEVPASTFNL